jgi:ElaB/YqjD/DUF883 family membrane-anchored ribosome-binding protein
MATSSEQTEKDLQSLRVEIDRLRADLGSLVDTLQDVAGSAGHAAVERAREAAARARGQAQKATEAVSRQIEERPLSSIVLAFVVGLLLGVLFGRQR